MENRRYTDRKTAVGSREGNVRTWNRGVIHLEVIYGRDLSKMWIKTVKTM
jgi:hypothetical protein